MQKKSDRTALTPAKLERERARILAGYQPPSYQTAQSNSDSIYEVRTFTTYSAYEDPITD